MGTSIRWRLVMMYVLLVIIVMMVIGTIIIMLIRSNEQESIQKDIQLAVQSIKGTITEGASLNELETELGSVYENTLELFLNKRVFLLDIDAQVVLPEADKGLSFPTHQVMSAIEDGTYTVPDKNVKLQNSSENYMGYAENIKSDGRVVYVIYILGNTSSIDENIHQIINVILVASVVAIFIAVILGYVFSGFLTNSIVTLSKKAREMARGHLDQPIKVHSNDEIGQLSKNFNRMSKSLNDTLNEITSEKNKLEIVFKHMTDGILVFDNIGIMIHSNPASINMLMLERQISFQEIFKPYLDIDYKGMKELVKEETISRLVIVESKYYSVYFAKFLDQYDEAVGLICVIQDITEYKKLESMQKEFVANVSHELRTPLTTIKSYTETLLDGAIDDKEVALRFLSVINNEGDRMTTLVQDLLELSKLDNSQVKFSMNDINLEIVLADSIDKYRIHTEKKQQSLVYHKPNFDCRIVGDVNRIEQVIKNIISNAGKYSSEGALIEVSVTDGSKYIKVIIGDSGMGISDEDIGRIFERFYRVDKARSREMGGTGLGLAIAKEIMDYHGGKIEVQSEFGVGTVFSLYFMKSVVRSENMEESG